MTAIDEKPFFPPPNSEPGEEKPLLFASDFHLSADRRPELIDLFRAFLDACASRAGHLYLLGDLFDFWVGSLTATQEALQPAFDSMRRLARAGTGITLMPGNRDFLLRERDARRMGARLARDPLGLTAGSRRILLTHGDIFCTHDRRYQRMKRILRNPLTRLLAGGLPDQVLLKMALRLRSHSAQVKRRKTEKELSLDEESAQSFIEKGFTDIVCGHFHQPQIRKLASDATLVTLSDWSRQGGHYAELHQGGLKLKLFSR